MNGSDSNYSDFQYGKKSNNGDQGYQSFDDWLEAFNDLFKRTISDDNKEENDFAAEYGQLA